MQRGVLKLTNQEATSLLSAIDLQKYTGTPLGVRLSSINLNNPEIEIFISEDELETIMDEIGMVDSNTNPILASTMNKVMELMSSFRS